MNEIVSGVIERVTFHNPENGFAVLKVHVRGKIGLVTVIGNLPSVNAGEFLEGEGVWIQDRDHGPQFKAAALRCSPPHSLAGIEKYLGSGLIKGIGPSYAQKIVTVFGLKTLQIIDESPSFLKQIKGLGPKRIELIRQSWKENKTIRDIMVFLQSYGIGTARAFRIFKTYGQDAVTLIRENPYRLAKDIRGVGFQTADELAQKIGINPHGLERARAAIYYSLERLANEGHVGVPEEELIDHAIQLTTIPIAIIQEALASEVESGVVIIDSVYGSKWAFAKALYTAEKSLAANLLKLATGAHPLQSKNCDSEIKNILAKSGLELDEQQLQAVQMASAKKILILTGGPGVGKTTIIRLILDLFEKFGKTCILCAPTGRAARRIAESTGREAKTIHRTLEFDASIGGFRRDPSQPLEANLVVVDETSMVDTVLMHHLVRAVPAHACLLLVGDVDQLPSVGPGRILSDMIDSRMFSTVRLTKIFRQAGRSFIVRAAHSVLHGEFPDSAPNAEGDFFFIESEAPLQVAEKVLAMVHDRIPKKFNFDPMKDIQVLTPMNRTELGAGEFNRKMQDLLNPLAGRIEIERFGTKFRNCDKVIQMQNNYQKEVFNGDVGFIKEINESEKELTVDFEGRLVVYDFGELDEISLAYALTIHKSQGSEYPAVVLPIHTQHYMMLQRNLLYTGITRGKKLVIVVGTKKALEIAISRQDHRKRHTALVQWLTVNYRS